MRIWLNPNLLSFYDLTVLDIEKKILEENIDIPAGRLDLSDQGADARHRTS